MKKLKSTLSNMVLSLGLITIGAGALLGAVYEVAKTPIAASEAMQQQKAIAEVAPHFDNNPERDKREYDISGNKVTVYPAYMNGALAGGAVKGSSMNGFAGEITVMCGFDADGSIRDYRVLKHAETPGLGAKMEVWFRDPTAARSVLGLNPGKKNIYVSKDTGGEVDGITAATISSRAFLETLRSGYEAYRRYAVEHGAKLPYLSTPEHDATSGASNKKQ